MARIMSRPRPVIEGNTGIKFSEIVVIAMAIAGIVLGVRWYLNYRQGPGYALQEFIGQIKAGNVGNQYAMIDDKDKKTYFPSQGRYEQSCSLAHGYTERIENVVLGQPKIDPDHPDKATIPVTVAIRASAEGKQLYQTGQTQTYTDHMVMHKNPDGNWKVVLSESIDKSTGKLHMQDAVPSPSSMF